MPDNDPTDTAPDRPDPGQPRIDAARAQIAAARQRREALIASGILPGSGADRPARLPDSIGPYHIKRVIASGGMGTVYEAVQEKPRRTVALKIMRHGVASRSALRRFDYESQILARLRHPGIAQVYEAGMHEDQEGILGPAGSTVPYFAMEYIPNAKPITQFADERKLGTRERMALFADVCDAVHHGHQKGIIHRDLKPGNILVDSHGQVKVIDFGVARSTDSDLAVTTLQTDVGQLVGTLQYMSPEQCEADPHDIDTRSDVYALGVVFYELLCGRLPYDVTRVPMHHATRIIREQDPTRPSTVNRTLRGDVETIALKALEKERGRRYQSAAEFGQDIGRYLSQQPVLARPASMVYQCRVFARRNKGVVASLAAVFVILAAGLIVSTSQYFKAETAREVAETERNAATDARQESEQVTKFLADMLAAIDPARRGKDVTVRELLDATAETIGEQFHDSPLVEARLRKTIGWSYRQLGLLAPAEQHLAAAVAIYTRLLGRDDPQTLNALNSLAVTIREQGRLTQAEEIHRTTLEIQRRVLGEGHPDTLKTLNNLAGTLFEQGRYAEGTQLLRHILEIKLRISGESDPAIVAPMTNLASYLSWQGRYREAMEFYDKALDMSRRVNGNEHPTTLNAMYNIADSLRAQGEFAESEELFRKTLESQRRVLGEEHPKTTYTMGGLALNLYGQQRKTEAEKLLRETVEAQDRLLGPDHPYSFQFRDYLANCLRDRGHYAEAEELYRKTLEARRRILGHSHADVAESLQNLATLLDKTQRWTEAEPLCREAEEIRASQLPLQPDRKINASLLGGILCGLGRFSEAEPWLVESLESSEGVIGIWPQDRKEMLERVVRLYESWDAAEPGQGYAEKAAAWRVKLEEWNEPAKPPVP